jgi:membrane protein implicated in regulation of membrane protease activity
MGMKSLLAEAIALFTIVFVVNAAVVWTWNLLGHGQGAFEWETALFFAVTLAIALPLARRLRGDERTSGG